MRTLQHRRQRDALLAEQHPAYPHAALHSMRRPTVGELEWVDRVRTATRPGKVSVSVPKSGRSEVLRRFGLADEADLLARRRRACRSAESGPGGGGTGNEEEWG